MPFAKFALADGSPSPCAFFQQTLANGAVYWNQLDVLEKLIQQMGGGSINAFHFFTDGFPPSFAVWYVTGRVWITFTGTVNLTQAYGDIIGSFAADYVGFGCQAHTVFLAEWFEVQPKILASMPAGFENWEINFYGHSMGGGIAVFGALDFARSYPDATVNLWTFGAPKVLTRGLAGTALPYVWFHTDQADDPMPFLPPNGLVSALHEISSVFWGIAIPWTHYGQGYSMDASGTLTQRSEAFWDPMPTFDIIASGPQSHSISTYMRASEIAYNSSCPDADPLLLTLSQHMRGLPFVQSGNSNVDPYSRIDIPWQNANAFQIGPNVPLNPGNLHLLEEVGGNNLFIGSPNDLLSPITEGEGMAVKITFFYNVGNLQGVSESWFSAQSLANQVTMAQIGAFLTARMGISGNNTLFTYCRIATLTPPATNRRLVNIFYPADLINLPNGHGIPVQGTYNWAQNDQGSNDPWSAMLVRRTNANKFSLGYVRGIPDNLDVDGGGIINPVPTSYQQAFAQYVNAVVSLGWGWMNNQPAANSPASLTGATQNADGTALLTFTPIAPATNGIFQTVAPGTRVQLRISGQILPLGFNGSYTFVVLTNNTCRSLRPLNVGTFVAGNGVGTIYTQTLVPVLSMKIEKMVSRRSGAPFGRSRGRRRNRVNG